MLDFNGCPICLQGYTDRTLLYPCFHAFCFTCICTWFNSQTSTNNEVLQSCPMCKQSVSYGIHEIQGTSMMDYKTHRFNLLDDTAVTSSNDSLNDTSPDVNVDRSRTIRAMVYQYNVWCKHMGSNTYSRYRPFPRTRNAGSSLIDDRIKFWLIREVHAVSRYLNPLTIISYISGIFRTRSVVGLQSYEVVQFLRPLMQDRTEHFLHELVAFGRSPFSMYAYDMVVEYQWPDEALLELEALYNRSPDIIDSEAVARHLQQQSNTQTDDDDQD